MPNGAAIDQDATGDPSRIRTCNPRSRNPLLYPVELWDRWALHSTANMKNPLSGQALLRTIFGFQATKRSGGSLRLSARKALPGHGRLPVTSRDTLRHMPHGTFSLAASAAISPSPFRALFERNAATVRVKELHHDRFGSRRSVLRHAGARPRRGTGRGQGLQTRRSCRFGGQAGGPDQERGRAGGANPARRCGPTPTPPSSAAISAPACRSSGRSRPPRPRTAPTGCGSPAPSSRSGPPNSSEQTFLLERASTAAYIAYQRAGNAGRGGRCAGRARPRDVRAQAVASGAGRAAAVARHARGRRGPRPVREAARRARFPAARLHRRFRLRRRRAPASSSPRTSPSASTSRRSWRWPAPTSRR